MKQITAKKFKKMYKTMKKADMAKDLNTTVITIYSCARKLGLTKKRRPSLIKD